MLSKGPAKNEVQYTETSTELSGMAQLQDTWFFSLLHLSFTTRHTCVCTNALLSFCWDEQSFG